MKNVVMMMKSAEGRRGRGAEMDGKIGAEDRAWFCDIRGFVHYANLECLAIEFDLGEEKRYGSVDHTCVADY